MPVESTLNAYPEWKIPGKVIAIIPTADRGKATVKVRVGLDVRDPRIVPDMGVRVSFLEAAQPASAQQPQGVRAPAAAIVERDGHDVVFALKDDDTVERRDVKTGIAMGDDRQVLSGLSAGDSVVLDPPDTLADGAKVRMAKEEADTGSSDE
jgi:multidrug efflux pump subunit AcrA (membrane-fusion protein)